MRIAAGAGIWNREGYGPAAEASSQFFWNFTRENSFLGFSRIGGYGGVTAMGGASASHTGSAAAFDSRARSLPCRSVKRARINARAPLTGHLQRILSSLEASVFG